MKSVAQYHVRSFAAHARQRAQLRHCFGHFSAVFLDDFAHRASNAFGFVAIEACGFDRIFQLGNRCVHIVFRRGVFPKQGRRNHVDAFVRGLRRENGRYKQLERTPKVQLATRVWINFWPRFQKLRYTFPSGHSAIILAGGYGFQSAFEINGAEYSPLSSCEKRIGLILAWARETMNRAAYQMTLRREMPLRSFSFFFRLLGHPTMNGQE